MSLRDDAIAAAGLADLVARREHGEPLAEAELEMASRADLLALGAAADRVRRADVGDEVRIHVSPSMTAGVVMVRGEGERGTALFRRLALARLGAPKGARVCVELDDIGLGLAQVALSFGVSDIAGVSSRRGLPVVGEKSHAAREEITGYVTRAQRTAVFVETDVAHQREKSS